MSAEEASTYTVEQTSKVEPWLLKNLCEPLVKRIPARISPNMITMANAVVMFTMFGLGAASPRLEPAPRMWALFGAAVAMFTGMILDSLDGMHARRTKQTSKLGEFLDHWLDAIHIPLVSGTLGLMLEVHPIVLGMIMLLGAGIYHAQLALYYRTAKFVSPPTSGMEAQVIGTAVLALTGVMFYFAPRYTPWVSWTVWLIALTAIWAQVRQWWFFYGRLDRKLDGILSFVLQAAALFGLYYLTGLGRLSFVLAVALLSFRCSGTYVLRTLAKHSYDGQDLPTWGFIAAAWGVFWFAPTLSWMGFSASALIVGLGAAYQVARNLYEVRKDYRVLVPAKVAS
ncbi:MAG: CDP-alcohol phosphatidyltransferase family protein [Myxococcota bacterium]